MMAMKFHTWISQDSKLTHVSFRCGVLGTQVSDIASGCISAQEKFLGSRSQGATAQMDVKQYYDCVDIPRILEWAQSRPGPMALLRAFLRAQMLAVVHVHHREDAIVPSGRSRGTFTGTRGAGALGRIPVEAALAATDNQRASFSWRLDDQHFIGVASYVGNLVAVGEGAAQVCFQLEVVAAALPTRWGLDIKSSNTLRRVT